tara:strand:- start:279 stop:731 length:453 start_codon:yes stop_codon:yes gene_type:complete
MTSEENEKQHDTCSQPRAEKCPSPSEPVDYISPAEPVDYISPAEPVDYIPELEMSPPWSPANVGESYIVHDGRKYMLDRNDPYVLALINAATYSAKNRGTWSPNYTPSESNYPGECTSQSKSTDSEWEFPCDGLASPRRKRLAKWSDDEE